MNPQEHLLAIVEPTTGGDTTIELANASLARGGQATVAVLLTDRVMRDIEDFAAAEDLSWGDASAQAFEQIEMTYAACTAAKILYLRSDAKLFDQLGRLVTSDITTIALPERLVVNFSVQAFARSIGVPVTVVASAAPRPNGPRTLMGAAA